MINPIYFTDRDLQFYIDIKFFSHSTNHASSILTIEPDFPGFGIETRYINTIKKEMATIYARLINHYNFEYHSLFSASFHKTKEEGQRCDGIEFFNNVSFNHNLTETDNKHFDVKSQLEHQIQNQETKESGCIFKKLISKETGFYKTGELNSSSFVKFPSRSNALIKTKNNDQFCFIWSMLASIHPCDNDHPNRVSNYKQNLDELNIEGFDFSFGFNCSDVHKFEKLNILSINIFKLNFYQDQRNRILIYFLLR